MGRTNLALNSALKMKMAERFLGWYQEQGAALVQSELRVGA